MTKVKKMDRTEFWELLWDRKKAEVKDVYYATPPWAIVVFIFAALVFSFIVIAFLSAWAMWVLRGLIVIAVVSFGMVIWDNVRDILKSKQ